MMQYPNQYYQNVQMCNTENCKRCPRKQGCSRYLSYLENIAQSEVNEIPMIQSNVDLSSVNQLISACQNSITELINIYSMGIENKFESLLQTSNKLVTELYEMKNTVIGLSEEFSKLDSFIGMVEIHNAQNNDIDPEKNNLAIYTGDVEQEKVLVEKKKKGIFGIGANIEWIEENKK